MNREQVVESEVLHEKAHNVHDACMPLSDHAHARMLAANPRPLCIITNPIRGGNRYENYMIILLKFVMETSYLLYKLISGKINE